ncbi:hypothetical protein [Gracilibacillus alcaliphilus]|uniref:hypothetical protein n=1 Tax=Gracilibacillus alcaliphilus TaxID=1401441 RepID=UPI00195E4E61|nr:hypothetical protein [Gracilibacillus alcaliphilus]MBM7676307.1 ATP/maltotriose-dependent transcriptional regulator MalT [Gracilibacillus alcaliphilus]
MQAVWLHSKTTIPKVADTIITRERLYPFIRHNPQARITIIQAAAGYGKATILSQWVQQLAEPVA